MRCHNAKGWQSHQRDDGQELSDADLLHERHDEHEVGDASVQHLEKLFQSPASPVRASISTDRIMQAVQQQRHITAQLEDLRTQQRSRIARMRSIGAAVVALGIFLLSCVPVLFLAMTIVQTDLTMKTLTLLNGVIDLFIILAQYVQTGLTLMTRNTWLFSGVAFVIVVMMGMWLRLMRPPQEA